MAKQKPQRVSKRGIVNEGRPLLDIDPEQVENLAAIDCSLEEMASFLKCSVDTLTNRFSEVIEAGRNRGKTSLKRKQFELAMQGDRGMLIWLGKIKLGQRETTEVINTHKLDTENLTEVQLAAQHLKDAALARTEFSST